MHYYVSRKNPLTWLMALCLFGSAVARIAFPGLKGSGDSLQVWCQILLPIAATGLYIAIVLVSGREFFFRTAIPVWMIALYSGIWISSNLDNTLLEWLIWIVLFSFGFMYQEITAGKYPSSFLLIMIASPICFILYYYREAFQAADLRAFIPAIADLMMLFGGLLCVFAIRIHPVNEYHPTWGDRSDGRRVRTLPPMAQVSPYIMVTRNSSTNSYSEAFEVTNVDRYIRKKRKEGMTNLGLTHVILACYCRAIAKYPGINRFISGQKVYSHGDDIQFCFTVKKEMTAMSPDTVIKVHLSPYDTIDDVYRKINEKVEEVKNTPLDSSFDNTAQALMMIPGVFLKFTVWLLKTMDYFGLLPKFLLEISPFHGSVFFTSMGSLGIPPIYHHLYDFGNLPVFGAFGMKRRALEVLEDGTVVQKKYVDFKFTLDERIVDGFYYAAFLKHYRRLFQHPEVLDEPPEEVVSDIP